MSAATAPLADRLLDRLDAFVPKPAAWAFAVRIWLASVLALYAAFWLQLDSASSAAVTVAILAQPRRGQAISKATYRFLGTIIGGVVSIVLMGLFGQDRVLLLVSFGLWLSLCVFVAQFLQDSRAYGAMLSGYTVAIIALAHIDAPQQTFDAALARVAAITLGVVSITFINDALASPSTWYALRPRLAAAFAAVKAFTHEAVTKGDPGPERTAAIIGQVAPMRADASAIGGELDDGIHRAAGARSAIAALYVMTAASRAFAAAYGRLKIRSPAVEEAHAICVRASSGHVAEPGPALLDRDDARMPECANWSMRRSSTAIVRSTRSWRSSAPSTCSTPRLSPTTVCAPSPTAIGPFAILVCLRVLFRKIRFSRYVANPPLAEAGIYVCVLGLLIVLL